MKRSAKKSVSGRTYALFLLAGISGFLLGAALLYVVAYAGPASSPSHGGLDSSPASGSKTTTKEFAGGADLFFAGGTTQILAPNGQGITLNATGSVGIGLDTPTQALDVLGYVKGRTGLCIGTDCRTAWPTFTDTNSGGTVTSVVTGTGLTGGPITGSGTVSLRINNGNTQSCSGTQKVSSMYSNGTVVCTADADANSGGTVTSVAAGTGLLGTTITSSGSLSLNLGNANAWTAKQTFTGGLVIQTTSGNPSSPVTGQMWLST